MSTKFKIANFYEVGLVLTTCLLSSTIASAQPIPDQTLPNNSAVNPEGNTYQINGGTVAGDNLLHSFEEFSVPTGTEVLFNNNSAIQNIISRVTGNSISNLDGVLKAMDNANLFLINPNGVIFGSNSSLDIGGSFLATTADSVQFADGMEFSASNPEASMLTISTPVGLQFGNQVGDITNQSGQLMLNVENTLALIGGDIDLQGGTIVSLANIELGSVGSNSQVNLIPAKVGWKFGYESVQNFRDIKLTQAKNLVDRESNLPAILSSVDIQVNGKEVRIEEGSQLIASETLKIDASNSLNLSGSIPSPIPGRSDAGSTVGSIAFSARDGGEIIINTGRLILQNGGTISLVVSFNFDDSAELFIPATGDGGDITINATESVKLIDPNSGILSSTAGFGSAGKITINTKNLSISNNAAIAAASTGANSNGEPLTTGLGGEIEINASESIKLNDASISSPTSGFGDNAGSVSLKTNRLSILNNSEISVDAAGSGLAGNLEIAANSLNLDRSSLNAQTRVGDHGNISLNNLDTLLLQNNSQITTNAAESATGGDITIDSDGIVLLDNSDISANAFEGRGGNIQITTQGIFQEPDSEITATSDFGINGEITLNSPEVDPVSGFFELPDVTIDADTILAQDFCQLKDDKIAKGSSFIITGRGGLTPKAEESLGNRDRIVNWASRNDLDVSKNGGVGVRQRSEPHSENQEYPDIQQAQGLVVKSDGSTWLTADAPETIPQNTKIAHPDCRT